MRLNIEERKEDAKQEFKEIIESYLLPLFDVRGSLKSVWQESINSELISIVEDENKQRFAYFYPCVGTEKNPSPFYCKIGIYSTEAIKKPATRILRELLKVSEYRYTNNFQIKRDYGKGESRQNSYKTRTLDLAFELGMCQWVAARPEDSVVLHTILCRMIEWAGRTYEGKNVPFGIVIDFNKAAAEGAADYLHFLTNDCSAVFTDGIYTGILLDKKGKVLSFLTQHEIKSKDSERRDIFVPYQFVDIAQNCIGHTIGIIVLTNGEIMLIRDRAICFAKRGRKWVYFDWTRVFSNLRRYFIAGGMLDENVIMKRSQEIYCTLLDVSFSHTGGCLALLLPNNETRIDKVIKERIDLFIKDNNVNGISKESREKIEVLTYLLSSPQNVMRSFYEIEKPLRKEILSLDGATVVSMDGNFYCAGSIVAVGGGSSGGGRTAAAKKLAEFGIGIKVSEDGYIEAYGNDFEGNSDHIVPIFKFK